MYNTTTVDSYTLWGSDAGKFYANTAEYTDYLNGKFSAQAMKDALNSVYSQNVQHPDTISLAAYSQGTWHATDKADLTLGVRNTYEDRSNWLQQWYTGGVNLSQYCAGALSTSTNCIDATNLRNQQLKLLDNGNAAAGADLNPIQGQSIYANSWSWLFNPSYKITPDILAYFSISFGEKSGAVQFAQVTDPSKANTNSYVLGTPANVLPEDALDYEAGLKTTWLDHKLTINPNLYYVQITNYQAVLNTQLPGQNTTSQILSNVPGVRLRGVEVEGNYITPSKAWPSPSAAP